MRPTKNSSAPTIAIPTRIAQPVSVPQVSLQKSSVK
jgi:hypothetical protein